MLSSKQKGNIIETQIANMITLLSEGNIVLVHRESDFSTEKINYSRRVILTYLDKLFFSYFYIIFYLLLSINEMILSKYDSSSKALKNLA